jgi:energy-coupling factor transporter ATP-binding protein EcfA2
MLRSLAIEDFKSIEEQKIHLGQVNFFVGANGSGKSNLLEALGVLSAAADGRVDDGRLLERGVRPGVPSLYKTAFATVAGGRRSASHIFFGAEGDGGAAYEVSLHNPLRDPNPAWRYKTEVWRLGAEKIVGRSPRLKENPNTEQGLAALKAVERQRDDAATSLLRLLQGYAIYSPVTNVLRGVTPETQPKSPIGLSGGLLPDSIAFVLAARGGDPHATRVCAEALQLIDWSKGYGYAPAAAMPLSPAAAATPRVIRFVDRYMKAGRNVISGYDASEGALFVLFAAVLAAHERAPLLFAVDNLDHGLNPILARALVQRFCGWLVSGPVKRQALVTTQNPLVLDGLPLGDERVRLFTVARTATGRTVIRRIELNDELAEKAKRGWTLSRLWVAGHLGGVPSV